MAKGKGKRGQTKRSTSEIESSEEVRTIVIRSRQRERYKRRHEKKDDHTLIAVLSVWTLKLGAEKSYTM